MSDNTITIVLRRMLAEPEFRNLLLRDPSAALAGYDLTPSERAALSGLKTENYDAVAADLEARVSHAMLLGQPAGGGAGASGGYTVDGTHMGPPGL
jgi:hypothetical protein